MRCYNHSVRRAVASGALALAALVPPVVWLWPALARGQAPSFRDQADFFFPLKLYTADRLRAGSLPLWNPLSGGGEPWLANAQSGVFYPPTLLFLIPSPGLAAALFLLAHFALAAWGMWRFCKEEGVTDAGALAACSIFCGSGLTASLSAYWNHFGALAFLPAIVALSRSGLRPRAAGAGLAALIGLQAMAGSPEISAGTLFLALVFVIFRREEPEGGWRPTSSRETLRRGAAAAALGLALAAWVLLPVAELAWRSERRTAIPSAERDLGAVTSGVLVSALGAAEEPLGNYFFASIFFGPLAITAIAAAFAERGRRRLVWILAAVGIAGMVLAASVPPGTWLRELPGLNRIRYPAKALTASLFAAAVLAGLGFDSLRFLPERRARILLCLLAAAGGTAVAISRPEPVLRGATVLGTVALVLLALLRLRAPAAGASLSAAAALCLVASFAAANRAVFRFVPGDEIRRAPESSRFLAAVPGRVLTPPMRELAPWVARDFGFDTAMVRRQREALIGYTNLLAGVRTIRSAAALGTAACRRMTEAIDGAEDLSRAAGAAAGRVYWTPFPPAGLGSRKVGDFYRAPLNPFRPRVSLLGSYALETDPAKAWTLAASGRSDWTRQVLLDREPSPRPTGAAGKFLIARLSEESPERVTVDVAADTPRILVLADMAYPGWGATVDGRPAALLIADGLFRAVAVEAGSHRVVFRYRPLSFYAGAAVSIAALAGLAFWMQRRPNPARTPA